MSDDLIKDEDWLRNDFDWRRRLVNEAENIKFYNDALNLIPKYPANKDMLLQYAKCFEEACEKMRELLDEQQN